MSVSRRLVCACLALGLCVGLVAEQHALGGIGYRYDGTGVVPASYRPPTSNLTVRWKVPTANWGYGSPVEVGDQVLVMCEPGSADLLFPTLVSYDSSSGKERWRTTIDPLLARGVGDAERKQIEEDWRFWHETWRFLYTVAAPYPGADEAGRKQINAKLGERGFNLKRWKKGYGLLRYLSKEGNARFSELYNKYRKRYGLGMYSWKQFGHALVGESFATPVSDGKHIVTITDQGVVACLDMDGGITWIAGTDYFGGGMGNVGSSPVLADGKVIFNMNSKTYAYDLASGQEVWTVGKFGNKHVNGHGVYTSPIITNLDGTLVVIDAKTRVIRVSDGKWYDMVTADGTPITATFSQAGGSSEIKNQIYTPGYTSFSFDRSTQEFFGGGKHFPLFKLAVQGKKKPKPGQPIGGYGGYCLSLANDIVTVTASQPKLMSGSVAVVTADRVYADKTMFDRSTGANLFTGKKNPNLSPGTRSIIMLGNGHVYGMAAEYVKKGVDKRAGTVVTVFNLDGKKTGELTLPGIDPAADAHVRMIHDQGVVKPGYCCPLNLGRDAVYVRDAYYLYCIGD